MSLFSQLCIYKTFVYVSYAHHEWGCIYDPIAQVFCFAMNPFNYFISVVHHGCLWTDLSKKWETLVISLQKKSLGYFCYFQSLCCLFWPYSLPPPQQCSERPPSAWHSSGTSSRCSLAAAKRAPRNAVGRSPMSRSTPVPRSSGSFRARSETAPSARSTR